MKKKIPTITQNEIWMIRARILFNKLKRGKA
jgi:hypothetical protein